MDPFWKQFCQDVGGYGRNAGTVFLITCAAGLILLVVGSMMQAALGDNFPYVVGFALFIVVYSLARAVVRARRDRGKYSIQPMSREEIRRARSKLLGNQQQRKL
jgi:hypothetical protein